MDTSIPSNGQSNAGVLSVPGPEEAPSGAGQNKLTGAGAALVAKLLTTGIDGAGPFPGAARVAEQHLATSADPEAAIRRLVNTHVRLAAGSGFVTGLGGLVTLPLALPAGITGLYVLGTRMTAGIAHLRGHDIDSDEVRSVILLALLGASGSEALKKAGITASQKMLLGGVKKVPGPVLVKINQAVGFRLVTKMGQKGVINLHKAVPLIGGPAGAAFDAGSCRAIAGYAKKSFPATGH